MVCSEVTGNVCGAYLGNGSMTDKSIEGTVIKCGNWREKKHGEMKETQMMWQGVWITSKSELRGGIT